MLTQTIREKARINVKFGHMPERHLILRYSEFAELHKILPPCELKDIISEILSTYNNVQRLIHEIETSCIRN